MNVAKLWLAAMSVLGVLGAAPALAQDFPNKTVTLVVGYPPGGGADAIGRFLAQKLTDVFGQPVVVDNRAGFSGNIAAQHVAKSRPDGYTLLVAPWTTYAINSILYGEKVGYALEKDFAPITIIGYLPMALIVNRELPVTSAQELVALAKSRPGALSFGSTGTGSLEQIAAELFTRQTQTSMLHVPYKGSGPAMADLMGGRIQVFFITAPTAVANAKSDKIRLLMLTTPNRHPALPELPTPSEAGIAGFEVYSTYGLLAPAGTPPAVVQKLNAELGKLMNDPEVKARFLSLGVNAAPSTPQEASARISADFAKWGKVIKDANIKVE